MTEWHLFIYRGLSDRYKKEPAKFADKEHLLESLKTGRLSDWSNVSLLMFTEQWHKEHPKALYNDEQFEFVDKFMRVFKKCDFYLIRPFIEKMEGTLVTFGLRWSLGMRPDRKILPPLSIRCTMRRLEHFLTTNIEIFQHEPTSKAPGLQPGTVPEASGDVRVPVSEVHPRGGTDTPDLGDSTQPARLADGA